MANKSIDVYRDWLGIKEAARPLTYYQLLRLKPFEDSAEKIREHYRKMNAHVRKFGAGEYSEQSQRLLNELAKAMLCLTDVQRKREYDISLGRETVVEGRRRTLEDILLANKSLQVDQLNKARNYANAIGLEVRDALLQQKLAAPETVWLAYAESVGLPYVELDDVGVDETLVPQIPPNVARQYSLVPVMVDGGKLLLASSNPILPDVEDDLRLRLGMPVRTVLCTPARINQAVSKYYPRDAVMMAPVAAPVRANGGNSAAAPAAKPAAPQTSEDQFKRWAMFAVIGFNIVVVLYMVLGKMLLGTKGFMIDAAIAVVLGLVVGGITFLAAKLLRI
jgi:hypothetical protein